MGEGIYIKVEVFSLGLLVLDIVFGINGYFKGRIMEVYGFESLGKIIVFLYVIVEV